MGFTLKNNTISVVGKFLGQWDAMLKNSMVTLTIYILGKFIVS